MESDPDTRNCQQRKNDNNLNRKSKTEKKKKKSNQTTRLLSHSHIRTPLPQVHSVPATLASWWWHQRARHTPTSGALRCCLFCLNVLPFLTTSTLLIPPAPLGLHQNCHLTQNRDYCLIFHCFRTRFLSFKNNKFINQNFTSNNGLQISKYNKHLNIIPS